MSHLFHALEKRLAGKKPEPPQTEIVPPPFHERSPEGKFQVALDERNIFEK
jgi:hypothetical protein